MARRHVWAISGTIVALAAAATALKLNSAKKVTVGTARRAPGNAPLEAIDHSAWDGLLQKYVDDQGLVDYRRWKQSSADLSALDAYLAELSRGDPSQRSRRDGRIAYWVNAYNALCLWGILREYPLTAVRPAGSRFWEYDLHRDLLLPVGDATYSLDDIEQQLAALDEPRIYFAVDCTYRNGPLLRPQAYLSDRVDAQLTDTARRLFARSNSLRVDAAQNELWVSPALESCQAAFGPTTQAAVAAVAVYFPDDTSRRLAANASTVTRYLPRDEQLNDQAFDKDPAP